VTFRGVVATTDRRKLPMLGTSRFSTNISRKFLFRHNSSLDPAAKSLQ
jgi:hypothetical protein